jgi:hypothetical protein
MTPRFSGEPYFITNGSPTKVGGFSMQMSADIFSDTSASAPLVYGLYDSPEATSLWIRA